MPFDANLTLINGVTMVQATAGTFAVPTTTSEDSTSKAKVVDLGASILSGSPEGTPLGGLSVALICTTSADTGNLVAYIEACDDVAFGSGNVTIGTFEDGSIAYTEAPFCFVIRVQTEMRYIRANLTPDAGTWTNIHVVVGTHHLERL